MTTVFRCVREALEVLADTASPLATPVEIARRKAFAILDGTLLRIDRVGTTGGRDRPYCSGKRRRRGVYVQVLGGSGRAVDLDLARVAGGGA